MTLQAMKMWIRWYTAANSKFLGHGPVKNKLHGVCSANKCAISKSDRSISHCTSGCVQNHRPYKLNYSELIVYRTYCKCAESVDVRSEVNKCLDNEEIMHIVKKMREVASETDKMVLSIPVRSLEDSVKALTDNGLSVDECLSFAKDPVNLKHLPGFTEVYSGLIQYGFPSTAIIEMVRQCPNLLTLERENLFSRYESLRKLGINDTTLEILVTKAPKLLNEDMKALSARFRRLKEFFKLSEANVLIEKTPGIMFEEPKEIEEKAQFALSELDQTNRQVLRSDFFSHTLEHIQARHAFLVRTGFFKVIKKAKGQVNTNPDLKDIVDISDEEFAQKFGNISLLDYETFKKLLKNEKTKLDEEEY